MLHKYRVAENEAKRQCSLGRRAKGAHECPPGDLPYIGEDDVPVPFLREYNPYDETNWLVDSASDDDNASCVFDFDSDGSTVADLDDAQGDELPSSKCCVTSVKSAHLDEDCKL